MTEDWLIENLPPGWDYDCTLEPEMAFVIYDKIDPDEFLIIPVRFLVPPAELKQ